MVKECEICAMGTPLFRCGGEKLEKEGASQGGGPGTEAEGRFTAEAKSS